MKAFWIKVINLAVICLVIFMYQVQARSFSRMEKLIGEVRGQVSAGQNESGQASQPQDGAQSDNGTAAEGAEGAKDAGYKDGTYEGRGTGYKGDIVVSVTVKGGRITDINIKETSDDEAYLSRASALIDNIIKKQITEGVDTVSGATFSSRGIIGAAEDALKEAKNRWTE